MIGETTIFNSPIVFYAWAEVADALTAKGMVTNRNDGLLTTDPAALKSATLPATIDRVVPMPPAEVMERIIAAVE